MPNPFTETELRQQAEAAIRLAEERARSCYGIKLPAAAIDFSLRGRCAGQACVERSGATGLRINLQLLQENQEDFLGSTIPHEIAHLVVYWQFRKKRQKPRPHGPEWQAVMKDCFGLAPQRCHNYPTTPARIVPRTFLYSCSCREHLLTSIMHNRISRSYRALCKACRTPLTFIVKKNA